MCIRGLGRRALQESRYAHYIQVCNTCNLENSTQLLILKCKNATTLTPV